MHSLSERRTLRRWTRLELEPTGFASQVACSPRLGAHGQPGGHKRGLVLSLTSDGLAFGTKAWPADRRSCSHGVAGCPSDLHKSGFLNDKQPPIVTLFRSLAYVMTSSSPTRCLKPMTVWQLTVCVRVNAYREGEGCLRLMTSATRFLYIQAWRGSTGRSL